MPLPALEATDSVPSLVSAFEERWVALPHREQAALAFRWLDRAIRSTLADGFVQAQLAKKALHLRQLPPIVDPGTLVRARSLVRTVHSPKDPLDLFAACVTVLEQVRLWDDGGGLKPACYAALMASRLVYGDDRLLPELERDLGVDGSWSAAGVNHATATAVTVHPARVRR